MFRFRLDEVLLRIDWLPVHVHFEVEVNAGVFFIDVASGRSQHLSLGDLVARFHGDFLQALVDRDQLVVVLDFHLEADKRVVFHLGHFAGERGGDIEAFAVCRFQVVPVCGMYVSLYVTSAFCCSSLDACSS